MSESPSWSDCNAANELTAQWTPTTREHRPTSTGCVGKVADQTPEATFTGIASNGATIHDADADTAAAWAVSQVAAGATAIDIYPTQHRK